MAETFSIKSWDSAPLPSPPSYSSRGDDSLPQNFDKKGKKRKIEYEIAADDNVSIFPNTKIFKKSEGKTFDFVRHLFLSRMAKVDPEAIVTDIHQIQLSSSRLARVKWNDFNELIEMTRAERDGEANVVYAWYAASKEKVATIFSNGFEVTESDPNLPITVRSGVFLSDLESPHLSAMQFPVKKEGEKHLILCRVVLGSIEKVDLEFDQTGPCRKEYDTGCDNPNNPHWYVIWNSDVNKRIFPEFVLTCKSSAIVPVEWKIIKCSRPTLPILIYKMKQLLPISYVRSLDAIYDAIKNGRMRKEVFVRQLAVIHREFIRILKPPNTN